MIKGIFEYTIVGPYSDREELTCEISYKDEAIAEINHETEELLITLYPSSAKCWQISLEEFQEALETGRKFLLCEE